MAFQKAERKKAKARIGLCGPAGSGKTKGALLLAFGLGGKIALIDTEHGSGELYSDMGEYDIDQISSPYTVDKYTAKIREAEQAGYDIIIIDSLTHAWAGEGGLLEQVDKSSASKNKFAAWRDATPKHNALINAILNSSAHIIATMRSKTEYVVEQNDRGKSVPRKVGMAPVQREGMDYEFTLVFDVEQSKHISTVSKDRTDLFNGFCDVLTEEHGKRLGEWLVGGAIDTKAIWNLVWGILSASTITAETVDEIVKPHAEAILSLPQVGQDKIQAKIDEIKTSVLNQ